MTSKAFLIEVELHIQTITCPGVWLCPNGNISLQVQMLGSTIQTRGAEPIFPIVIDEKFVFERTYFDVGRLIALQKILYKDLLYIEMIQWQNCKNNSNVLATFRTSLAELLFPESRRQCTETAEVDLLMEPMKNFPGILAPKIEVSTLTTIRNKFCNAPIPDNIGNNLITVCEKPCIAHQHRIRQRPVCHTKAACHRSKKCAANTHNQDKRPPFVVRKVTGQEKYDCQCKECTASSPERQKQLAIMQPPPKAPKDVLTAGSTVRRVGKCCDAQQKPKKAPIECTAGGPCECGDDHEENCVVCAKYKHYFESKAIKSQKGTEMQPGCTCERPSIPSHPQEADADKTMLCNYPPPPPPPRQTLTERIHSRMENSFRDCCRDSQAWSTNRYLTTLKRAQGDVDAICSNCDCDDLQSCTADSIAQFYKKLYTCVNKCSNR